MTLMAADSILLISADAEAIAAVHRVTRHLRARLHVAGSLRKAADAMRRRPFDAVLVQVDDGRLAPWGSQEVLALPSLVIAVARKGSISAAVKALQAGAADYLPVLPGDPEALAERLRSVLMEGMGGQAGPDGKSGQLLPFPKIITADARTLSACGIARRFADTDVAIWLRGNTGTGKSLLGQQIHLASGRQFARFVEVNCASLMPSQVGPELFGNSEPARLAGDAARRGALGQAAGGTLLLSDPAGIRAPLREQLLCALAEARSGRAAARAPEVRLMVATTQDDDDEETASRAGAIRSRRDVVTVGWPPLCERIADIPLLARHFVRFFAVRHGRRVERISAGALGALVRYGWPGNVRELRAVVEFAVLLARGGAVEPEHLPEAVRATDSHQHGPLADGWPLPLKRALREPERRHILRALNMTNWNKLRAARRLRISRSTLYKKMREHGLEAEPVPPDGHGFSDGARNRGARSAIM